MNNVVSSTYSDFRQSSGIGRIIIPSDVNRDTFVAKCLQIQKVSILCEGETAIHNVFCTTESIKNIIFPVDSTSTGSVVVWIKDQVTNEVIVTGTLPYQTISNQQENSYFIEKKSTNTTLTFQMIPESKSIVLNGISKEGVTFSQSFTGLGSLIEIIVNGLYQLQSKELNLTMQDNFVIQVENDGNNTYIRASESLLEINALKVSINEGTHSAVLGELLTELLHSLIEEISKITISTPQGQMPILNKVTMLKLKDRVDIILSDTLSLS